MTIREIIDRVDAGTATSEERDAVAELRQVFDWIERVWEGWEPGYEWLPSAMEEWQQTCDVGAREPILTRLPEDRRYEVEVWMDVLAEKYADSTPSPCSNPPLVVVVTGGRDYRDREAVRARLDAITSGWPMVTLYHGGCTLRGREGYQGADRLADEWAREHGLTPRVFEVAPETWTRVGPKAGPQRNRAMLQAARVQAHDDGAEIVCVAFPGGEGTKSCVDIALYMGISVVTG